MPEARVRAFAKLNLSLEVLNKRADGFHNLRTIFQTISLHDTITVEVKRSRTVRVAVESNVGIPGENLMVRATHAVLANTGAVADVRFRLRKKIPLGGGLGGGSTDAAAVLLILPSLLKRTIEPDRLLEIAAALGSDVPFFFLGGTALGVGRGTEIYPLPDPKDKVFGLLVDPSVHVSTVAAYRALGRTDAVMEQAVSPAERLAQALATAAPWTTLGINDFEETVFAAHPVLGEFRAQLEALGAGPARMTGSGAALYGLFDSERKRDAAAKKIRQGHTLPFSFVSRRQYRKRGPFPPIAQ